MNRNLAAIAELAPGVTDNGPNAGQVVIAGAFAYDNVFLLNGVDINDNLFGTANNLFIEDAIQEVQVITSGVSAEFGRFSGGVINAVTKSGGNTFFGSYRADFTNPAWRDESRFVKEGIAANRPGIRPNRDDTTLVHMATLGGPIVKDRLWFFGAARREALVESRNLTITGNSYDFREDNNRYEGKLTGAINQNHNLQATYIRNSTSQFKRASINTTFSIDEATLVDRTLPNDLFVAPPSCSWRRSTRRRSSASEAPVARPQRSPTRRSWPLGFQAASRASATTTRRTSAHSTPRTATTGSTRPPCRTSSRPAAWAGTTSRSGSRTTPRRGPAATRSRPPATSSAPTR
jgi:hypothetical protein